ncbi:MAG: alpha/beta hydrolase [Alphaproteobacteria bacterium]|nr:alpha/beta hydrolase [Alphaproteobacteria bacterium]
MDNNITPDIEERFRQPKGWRWHHFERIKGRKIRFGSVFPQDSIPDAVIICLQGVREFSEKYFETAHWCLDHNFAFWTLDWAGQGESTRYIPANPQKRFNGDFREDVADLHYFINEYIKHSSVHPDKGRIPLAMLAHSMGAHIGLRLLHDHPKIVECAAMSAPMIGLKVFEHIPNPVASVASTFCSTLMGNNYIPGGKDWVNTLPSPEKKLTSDPVRSLIHNQWCELNESLRCGDVTYGWVHQAHKSCMSLQNSNYHKRIETPCIFGIPEHEHLVDNKTSLKTVNNMKNTEILEYPESYHEILMEKDEIRNDFLQKFYNLIDKMTIKRPETLKPF